MSADDSGFQLPARTDIYFLKVSVLMGVGREPFHPSYNPLALAQLETPQDLHHFKSNGQNGVVHASVCIRPQQFRPSCIQRNPRVWFFVVETSVDFRPAGFVTTQIHRDQSSDEFPQIFAGKLQGFLFQLRKRHEVKLTENTILATSAHMRNNAPSFLPKMRPAPSKVVPRKTMAQTPRAAARKGPFPSALMRA